MSYLNNTTALENDPPQPDPDKYVKQYSQDLIGANKEKVPHIILSLPTTEP